MNTSLTLLSSAVPALLPSATTLPVLSCTGARSGTFSNLSAGSTITAGPNTFAICYTTTSATTPNNNN